MFQAKSEEELSKEKLWLDAERLWLIHRGGFSAVRRLQNLDTDPGKIRVCLEETEDILTVDEDDVEKANPPQFDRVEDLSQLRYLNESSVLHTLRQRYATNLIHTYGGSNMIVVNPMAPLAIYSDKVVSMFKGCKTEDMPPHIFSMAQSAYHNMLQSRRDQSLVFLGRSGAGKTINFKHCISYLVQAAGVLNKALTLEKLNAIWLIEHAFGNCKTQMNSNSTRFTQIFSLDFDQSGVIASASTQVLLFERSRVAKRQEAETTFHALYKLLAGAEGLLRKELHLEGVSGGEQNAFVTPLHKHEDKQRAQEDFIKLCAAFRVLNVSEVDQKTIWMVLAAIYHLGCAGVVKAGPGSTSSTRHWQFAHPGSAQRAAHLLGTTVEELARVTWSGATTPGSGPRVPFRTPSPTDRNLLTGSSTEIGGQEGLEGVAVGLYAEVFNAVIALINRSISTSTHTVSSILLVDSPGFQNPASCGRQTGATFEDLCHNYLQERLQLLFHQTNLVAPRDRYVTLTITDLFKQTRYRLYRRYAQENIECTFDASEEIENSINPGPMVSLLDKQPQNSVIRTSQTDLRDCDRRGLLWLLDEEAIYPGSNDETFVERIFAHYGDREHQVLLRKAPGNGQFVLQHLQGTNPVLYTANGWLKASRENQVSRNAVSLLQESTK